MVKRGGRADGGGSARGGTRPQARQRRRRAAGTLGVLLAAATLAGCGNQVSQAVGDAAQAAHTVTSLSEKAMRSWCPAAVADGGRGLTQTHARGCLRRAWGAWLGELERHG
jgi:hypothetical protein